MHSLHLSVLDDGRKAIIIRTSDRITFKQCRRKWSWSSHLKGNLGSRHLAGPLWFGSGVHYGLEDYHGYNHFGSPADAFRAYCIATSKQFHQELPSDALELYKLGTALLDYYTEYWLQAPGRPVDETFYHPDPITGEDVPQVEVSFEFEVPLDTHPRLAALAKAQGADCVLYRGTIDRMGVDSMGNLWVYEYKTAKRAEHLHYETDPQVTVYIWAASHIYNLPVAGVVYLQFVKNEPKIPRPLSTGKISTASNLVTSVPLYRRGLENLYGSVERAPIQNRDFLTALMTKEDENKDRFITRDYVTRNQFQLDAEAEKIILECEDMLNPDLPLYPNPTRDCSRMCGFLSACVAFDAGADWEGILNAKFGQRGEFPEHLWRKRMPSPEKMAQLRGVNMTPDLEEMQARLEDMPEQDAEAVMRGEQEVEFTFQMDA
jgi:hypothetical protein